MVETVDPLSNRAIVFTPPTRIGVFMTSPMSPCGNVLPVGPLAFTPLVGPVTKVDARFPVAYPFCNLS